MSNESRCMHCGNLLSATEAVAIYECPTCIGIYKAMPFYKMMSEFNEIIKAVAHVGVDWGYGKYELEQGVIDKARKIYEAAQKERS